jgi:hypothetical protein
MSEYLEKKCMSLGIRLVYTYNKSTVLSAEINKEKPLLIADMMFKNCPDSVSQAIIGFFTDISRKSFHEKIIRDFVEEYFKPYRPGNIKYFDLSYLVKHTQNKNDDYEEKLKGTSYKANHEGNSNKSKYENSNKKSKFENDDYEVKLKDDDYKVKFDMDNIDISKIDVNDPNLVELYIYNINGKDFWGGEKQYKANNSIKPIKDDELQLNIVVLPPGT